MTKEMTAIESIKKSEKYKSIMKVVSSHRLVDDRVHELERRGFTVDVCPMGSGGVGQVREMSDHFRVQVGYGVGRHNYASCVIINK